MKRSYCLKSVFRQQFWCSAKENDSRFERKTFRIWEICLICLICNYCIYLLSLYERTSFWLPLCLKCGRSKLLIRKAGSCSFSYWKEEWKKKWHLNTQTTIMLNCSHSSIPRLILNWTLRAFHELNLILAIEVKDKPLNSQMNTASALGIVRPLPSRWWQSSSSSMLHLRSCTYMFSCINSIFISAQRPIQYASYHPPGGDPHTFSCSSTHHLDAMCELWNYNRIPRG